MRTYSYILLVLVWVGLVACERPADVEIPNSDPKPVVFAFLSPEDSIIKVTVTLSNPIFTTKPNDNNIKIITDAKVFVENEAGQIIPLNFEFFSRGYVASQSQFKIEPGKKYKVNVSFEKYKVYGETTVPSNTVPIKKIDALAGGRDQFDNIKFSVYTRWDDIPNQSNYYRVVIEAKSSWGWQDTSFTYLHDMMQSDASNDGKELFVRNELYYYGGMTGDKNLVDIYLIHSDVNYYEYHKRRINYFGEDPFSEPTPMFTNIQGGGLGVVGSYRKVVQEQVISE